MRWAWLFGILLLLQADLASAQSSPPRRARRGPVLPGTSDADRRAEAKPEPAPAPEPELPPGEDPVDDEREAADREIEPPEPESEAPVPPAGRSEPRSSDARSEPRASDMEPSASEALASAEAALRFRQTRAAAPPKSLEVAAAPRVFGELGESCRAALDCRPELRCKQQICSPAFVPVEEMKPDPPEEEPEVAAAPQSRLRLGLEVLGGLAWVRSETESIVGESQAATYSSVEALLEGSVFVELGLSDDLVLVALEGGVSWPRGLDVDGPSATAALRSGLRLWRGSPSVGLYLEPRVRGYLGGIPGDFGFGGDLGLRFRLHWLDIGLRGGGASLGEGIVRVSDISAVREQTFTVGGGLFLALSPEVAAW